MPPAEPRLLVLNPGSTSTKIAVYVGDAPVLTRSVRHLAADMETFRGRPILDQRDFRAEVIGRALATAGHDLAMLDAVTGRGGLLKPLASGTYRVNDAMLAELHEHRQGEHASNLGAVLAHELARPAGAPSFIVDPVSVDEWPERARLSGLKGLDRISMCHTLNTKAVAKRYAKEHGKTYTGLRLIVLHVGSGISVSAHEDGRMIDNTNTREEGAFSTERAGGVPVHRLVELCFSGTHTRKDVERMLFGDGGMYSYLGTKDLVEIEKRIAAGDQQAALVFDAMVYQIAKEIGAAATVLSGRVDALLVTGGMARSTRLIAWLRARVEWIAPIAVYPGEDELKALAEGTLRVLRGEEEARIYG